MSQKSRGNFLTISAHVCALLFAFASSRSNAAASKQLSNLSDGTFERQLEVPPSENLVPNSPMMLKAVEGYSKLPFDIGERIRFVVTYLGAKGGQVEVLVRTPVTNKDIWAHRITGEVKSADWFRWVFQIHDAIEGIFENDPGLTPVRFYINQLEGDYRQSKVLDFDTKEAKIRQKTARKGRDLKNEEFDFSAGTKDALGALYYFREKIASSTLKEKAKFEFPVFTSEKTWKATSQFLRQETKEVEGQKYECDVFQLVTSFGGLMEQKGDIKLWLTRDSRRLPVYIEAALKFGSIKVALIEWDQGYADPTKKKIYEKIRADVKDLRQ